MPNCTMECVCVVIIRWLSGNDTANDEVINENFMISMVIPESIKIHP